MRGRGMTPAALAAGLADGSLDPADHADMLAIDPSRSEPFRPWVGVVPALLPAPARPAAIEELVELGRRRRYAARIDGGWAGARLVAAGDSWFHFPLARDIVRQLEADHAILSQAGGPDLLHHPLRQQSLCAAVADARPHAVLLSVGGRDLFAPASMRALADPGNGTGLDRLLDTQILRPLAGLLGQLSAVDPQVPVLLHGYAPAVARGFIWLGVPLFELGVTGRPAQIAFIATLVDRFHAALARFVAQRPGLDLVDCRDAIGAHWFDELHPNNQGFAAAANRFRAALSRRIARA